MVISTSLEDGVLFSKIEDKDFSLKLDVSNKDKSDAEQVQVVLDKIIFENKVHSIEPVNLTLIQSDSHYNCDLLFFIKDEQSTLKENISSYIIQLNELKKSGHYKIELVVGAKNIKTTFWEIDFNFNPDSTDKGKIISDVICKKKGLFSYIKHKIKNIVDCFFIISVSVIFFSAILKTIKNMEELEFFIASFGYFIACFSVRTAILNLFDNNEDKI